MELTALYLFTFMIFLLLNGVALFLFWYDKKAAMSGAWRISEAQLLGIALIGGSFGASFACTKFRHKTRKQPFAFLLFTILTLHSAIILGVTFGWVFSQTT